ncbi:alpha/beta fold hydrolase [Blastococcus sp. VKM Ac-2987]|uniref:alpha/beta fold hydrolase n=1 Tax=Blastococcus sp. VKM Ac-2987 TaxID=3004141 RepID=UPI0022AB8AA9|nr:alpha/beta fold hydrolase [Blastococcus sp. VKM Ac-2987]MCZ2857481.1 alpha/beta fold hydrolase [Blastococcus sp. VKM Ac-2987]
MRTTTEKQLNAIQRPDAYREVLIPSAGAPIVLSVWDGEPDRPAVVFLPGTMTHPLFYEDFLDALNRAGVTAVGVHSQGHGKSPRVHRPLVFSTLVTNARDAVAWTRAEFPGRLVAVLGSSQGGVVAMALAGCGERLDAVFAHNVLDPTLPSSVGITRFPGWVSRVYPALTAAFRVGGRLLPRVPVPFDAYLDMARVARDPADAEYFYTDPLGLRAYPLGFMASLFTADLSGMTDGSIHCPVTVVAGRGDPLFPLTYTQQVYGRIVAPAKELLVVDSDAHLLFNEDLDVVLAPLLDRLLRQSSADPTA